MGASIPALVLVVALGAGGASAANASAPAATAQVAQLTERQLDQLISKAQALPIGARVEELSRLFLGTPYVDYPLGEGGTGPEPQARFRLDGVDCQTYVETVLAMANATNLAQAKAVLDDIRYAKLPPSFSSRNHFTEAQWLPANIGKGYLREEVRAIDGNARVAELVLERSQWSKVPALQRLGQADIPDGRFAIPYLPLADMRKRAGRIPLGSVILVVREADPNRVVRVSHMGFVVRGPKGTFVRHASPTSALGQKVVDEPFDDYLTRMASFRKWPVQGFGLARPLDAKLHRAILRQSDRNARNGP
jgi:hypothetical protein